jgi:hypothetical protein
LLPTIGSVYSQFAQWLVLILLFHQHWRLGSYNKEKYLSFLREKFNFSGLLEAIKINNNDVKSFEQLMCTEKVIEWNDAEKYVT